MTFSTKVASLCQVLANITKKFTESVLSLKIFFTFPSNFNIGLFLSQGGDTNYLKKITTYYQLLNPRSYGCYYIHPLSLLLAI